MPSYVVSKMGGVFSACFGTTSLPRTEPKIEYIPAARTPTNTWEVDGTDNPLSDQIVEEEYTRALDLPEDVSTRLQLLHAAHEAVEDMQNILPCSMNEIDLRDTIPSAEHMQTICSCMKRYSQLQKISLSRINPRQLERVVPWADKLNLKISIRDLSITPTEEEFQKLQRLLSNHHSYLTSLFEESFLSISLLHIDLTVSRFGQHIVPWITRSCQNLELFALLLPHSYLNDFAIIVSRSPVKIKRLTLFEQIKFVREELHVTGANAICRLISSVSEKIILDFKVEDPYLLNIIQNKLNSLPQTNLEIQFIDQIPGLYRLRWREPMICPRSGVCLQEVTEPTSSTDE